MNPNTGLLIAAAAALTSGFERIPPQLEMFAKLKLAGRPQAQVNLRGHTPLAQWARKKRKAKIAAASRRKNRK